jgi:bacterioferritin-associated ferredoxin
MYVCLCTGATERDVLEAIEAGASSVEEVSHCTGAGTRCGSCVRTVAAMLDAAETGPRARACSGLTALRVLTSAA